MGDKIKTKAHCVKCAFFMFGRYKEILYNFAEDFKGIAVAYS